jgi:diguanylate cyclase (GGDEF)-like protein
MTPFAAAAMLAFALVPIGTRVAWDQYGVALAITAFVGVAAVVVPWRRLPAASKVVLPLLFLIAAALLRDAAGGASAGVGALPLLPVFWVALHGRRSHLIVLIIATAAYFALPPLLLGGPHYPLSGLRMAATYSVVAGIIGATAQSLVGTTRAQARESGARRLELERIARDRERLLAELEHLAVTDPLTGLGNRRAWISWLESSLTEAAGTSSTVAVAILDLDRFKQFNDTHGHARGDQLLIEAAKTWTAALRPADHLARIGGEEFAVVLSVHDAAAAIAVVERMRAATPMRQTASAGIAIWNHDEPSDALVERADRALYDAKHSGRDRTIVTNPELRLLER